MYCKGHLRTCLCRPRGVGGVIAPTHSQPGARRKCVVSTMLQQLYHKKRASTTVQEGLNIGKDRAENLIPLGLDPPNIQPTALHYPTGHVCEYVSYTVLMITVELP